MARRNDPSPAPPCPTCGLPMTLVLIEPKVASFTELYTFRWFGCGDVRAVARQDAASVAAAFGHLAPQN